MAQLLSLKTFVDKRGNLTVIEKIIPFEIKRIFYIYAVDSSIRGCHRHKATYQAAICIKGTCHIFNCDGEHKKEYILDSPDKCLIIEPKDWHYMYKFSEDAILMVLASHHFDANDYIFEPYFPEDHPIKSQH